MKFSHEILVVLTKFRRRHFGTLKFEVWSIWSWTNSKLLKPLIIYWQIFALKIQAYSFLASWYGMKFNLALGILLNKWSWLLMSLTWSRYFVWKWFVVCKLHVSHLTEVMTPYIFSFYEELSLFQGSSFIPHMEVEIPRGEYTSFT